MQNQHAPQYFCCMENVEKSSGIPFENLTREDLIHVLVILTDKFQQQEKTLSEYQEKILKYEHELAQLRRMIFGSRSERFVPLVNPQQTTLPLETETVEAKPATTETITYTRKKTQQNTTVTHKRLPLPAHLERVVITIEPKEDVSGLKKIGEEITEELEWKPGKLFVNKYVRPKYAKPETPEMTQEILIGELPSRPIEKGIPGPGLLAQIIIDKYVDHLPCYRQIQRFERISKVKIPASTMSEWLRAACNLVNPLYAVLLKEVLAQTYLMADETPIKVLDKDKKGKTHLGYYWVYHAPLIQMTLYEYRPGRGRDGPVEMLKDFKGKLQTDGYAAYESLNNPNIILINCMAHARRYFDEARNNDVHRAEYALQQMQLLYDIEHKAREGNLNAQQRFELRQEKSIPVLQSLELWLKENILRVLPKSPIGKAIAYSLERWDKLSYYASDGEVEIDNNKVENSIRPLALGRKNYLFAGSHNAAQRTAEFYSLLNTCKWNGIEPWEWLKETLEKIPDYKANRLRDLLPLKNSICPQQN